MPLAASAVLSHLIFRPWQKSHDSRSTPRLSRIVVVVGGITFDARAGTAPPKGGIAAAISRVFSGDFAEIIAYQCRLHQQLSTLLA